jgi:hypothetical protein
MKTRAELLAQLPEDRREAIETRTQGLILKEKILREMRKDQGRRYGDWPGQRLALGTSR